MANNSHSGQNRTLVLFDLDNTLTDTLKFWAQASGSVIATLASALNRHEDDIFALLRTTPEQHRFGDIIAAVSWLDENGALPKPSTAEERHQREILKSCLRSQWRRAERDFLALYDDAFHLVSELKKKGTSVAVFTDAEAPVMIRRLWMLGHNDARRDGNRDAHDFLDMVDHVYCRPGISDDSTLLRDCDHHYVLKLKQKTTIWRDGISKPSPDHAALICRDFSTAPAQAVMIGDSNKDGGCARPLGMDFLWYEPGTRHCDKTIATVTKISDPGWHYGGAHIRARFNETSAPTHTLRSLSHALELYDFTSGNPFAATTSETAQRLEDQIAARVRHIMGPATHLNP